MSQSKNTRLHVFVEGYVQAIGFRFFTMQNAYVLKITGWVRNRINGEVEVIAEGSHEALEQFLQELHRGPSMAQVKNVRVEWEDYTGKFTDFTALPTV
ncbi:MAG TPA: acylphosphatase [Anaerolineae bacterium]|nr:acylphosphatase [Anaerolineae bacterium]